MAEALQPLQRALRSQDQGSAPRSTAPTPPQSRPATPQFNPPLRGAWQNQSQRYGQGPRAGNANQSAGTPRTFSQPQGQGGSDDRPRTPPNPQRDRRQFQQRPVTPPGSVSQRRRGCYVCGALGCHTVIHERNGTLPPNVRRAPPTGNNDRSRNNNNNNSRLNANARVFTPSPNGQCQSPSGNSGGNPGSGNRVPPLQRPSSGSLPTPTAPSRPCIRLTLKFCDLFYYITGTTPPTFQSTLMGNYCLSFSILGPL